MKCLLKYEWVKLTRNIIPDYKGIMGYWAKLAGKAAFRNGQAVYCGHINQVNAGMWSGGVVGLKSILGVKSRAKALEIMDSLAYLGYIEYTLDVTTKKLTYIIKDFVVKCTGEPCIGPGAVYATDGYGFLCLPRDITARLANAGYTFEESDAWIDLWCHTVWEDPNNIFSHSAPAIQYGRNGSVLTLETLGTRWGWEKTRVWRFLQKHRDIFTLLKLPGSFGCLIFNQEYPTSNDVIVPDQPECVRILDEVRDNAKNAHFDGTDNTRINKIITVYSHLSVKQGATMNTSEHIIDEKRIKRQETSADITQADDSPKCNNCEVCPLTSQYADGQFSNILFDIRIDMTNTHLYEVDNPVAQRPVQFDSAQTEAEAPCIDNKIHMPPTNEFLQDIESG